jgi:cell filamentation protein
VAADPYVYTGTDVLRNLLDLRDGTALAKREAAVSAIRIAQLERRFIPGDFDLAHLQATHRHIFGDIYPWVGELRTVRITKGGDLFALPEHIGPYLMTLFADLPHEDRLHGLGREQVLERLTHYYAEINAVHPFREGNGRTQRAFLGQVAKAAGHPIAWVHLDAERNILAAHESHRGDNSILHECRLVRAWRVVRVALGCLDVPMPHPLLESPHGNAGTRHRRAERVALIVKAVRLFKLRGLEREPVAAQNRRLVERPGGVGIGEHESIAAALPTVRLSRSSSPATSSAIGTLRVERRDLSVPNSPST